MRKRLSGSSQTVFRPSVASMEILRLSAHPEFAAETAALMAQIWPGHYGPDGDGDAQTDVQSRIADDRAAIAVVDGVVVGTVAISEISFGAQGDGPWLVGLCTSPEHRGQGIASLLSTWAMGVARMQGRAGLFATTRDAASIFERLGWRKLRYITDDTGKWSIWTVDLSPAASSA